MKKNNVGRLLTLVGLVVPLMVQAVTSATVIALPEGGQANVAVSQHEANLLTVAGDRITAINTPDGALLNVKKTDSGGVVFTAPGKKPFTFVIETEGGHNFSIRAVPGGGGGRTVQLVSELVGYSQTENAWERAQPYETLLLSLNREAVQGKIPRGYSVIPVTNETLSTPAGLLARAERVWRGSQLTLVRFSVLNTGRAAVSVAEGDFWQPGIRAVMFAQPVKTLLAGGQMQLYVTRANGGEYGKH